MDATSLAAVWATVALFIFLGIAAYLKVPGTIGKALDARADRIRNELDMPTMAVGNIYETDHVNSILMAGRADLVCLARPHLADPYWTLHAAVALGDTATKWPDPYLNGRDQALRLQERAQEAIRV